MRSEFFKGATLPFAFLGGMSLEAQHYGPFAVIAIIGCACWGMGVWVDTVRQ